MTPDRLHHVPHSFHMTRMDEITIPRDELAANLKVHLRVLRQKQPALFRNLAALKAEDKALTAFADAIADWMTLTGKRIVRDRQRAPGGAFERNAAEDGIEVRPSEQVR
jgi:hypothetical protein